MESESEIKSEISSVGSVTSGAPLESRRPEDYDLRFFRRVTLCDSVDGTLGPADGTEYTLVLYGNQPVYELWKRFANCCGGSQRSKGDFFFDRMLRLSELYLMIQGIAKKKAYPNSLTGIYGEHEKSEVGLEWDLIFPGATFDELLTHPQFKWMCGELNITFEPAANRKYLQVCVPVRG